VKGEATGGLKSRVSSGRFDTIFGLIFSLLNLGGRGVHIWVVLVGDKDEKMGRWKEVSRVIYNNTPG